MKSKRKRKTSVLTRIQGKRHRWFRNSFVVTLSRQEIYDYLIAYKLDHDGLSPTISEMTRALKISSTSVCRHHLKRLELIGLISLIKLKPGGIMITGGRWIPPADTTIQEMNVSSGIAAG